MCAATCAADQFGRGGTFGSPVKFLHDRHIPNTLCCALILLSYARISLCNHKIQSLQGLQVVIG